MAPPVYSTGQVLNASDCNNWFVPLASIKTADQSVTSSTTVVNDSELVLSIAANVSYKFDCFLEFEGGAFGTADMKWTWVVPASAFLRYTWQGFAIGGGANAGEVHQATDVVASSSNGAGNLRGVSMQGTLVVGVNAGTLQLKWAQNTSSATTTTMHAQSCMYLYRVS